MAGGGRIRQLRYFGRRKRPHTHPHAGRKPQCCFHEIIAFSLQLSQECIKLNATTCVVVRTRSPPKREREKRVMNARTRSGITTPPPPRSQTLPPLFACARHAHEATLVTGLTLTWPSLDYAGGIYSSHPPLPRFSVIPSNNNKKHRGLRHQWREILRRFANGNIQQ